VYAYIVLVEGKLVKGISKIALSSLDKPNKTLILPYYTNLADTATISNYRLVLEYT
jgi:hypothetical protein